MLALASGSSACRSPVLLIYQRRVERTRIGTAGLVCADIQGAADGEPENAIGWYNPEIRRSARWLQCWRRTDGEVIDSH